MPFDSVPALLGLNSDFSQVFPALLILSAPYLFFGVLQPSRFLKLTVNEVILISAVIGYLLLVTTVNYLLGTNQNLTGAIFFKQLLALVGGLMIYVTFRITELTPQRIELAARRLLIVLIPIVAHQAFFTVGTGARVNGFSTEPSHFGNFLVFFVLPALFLGTGRGWTFFCFLVLCNIYILLTFSLTAIVAASAFYLGWFLVHQGLSLNQIFALSALFVIMSSLVVLGNFDFGYLLSNLSAFSSREAFVAALSVSGSLVDRLYSFWGPVYGILSGSVTFGAGIGGDFSLLPKLVPLEQFEIIQSVRSGPVGVSSFAGKVLTWGGVPLTALTVFIFSRLFWQASPKLKVSVLPVLLSSLFSMGALVVPYIWFWAAFLMHSNQRVVRAKLEQTSQVGTFQ